jgi:RNA polymerase-binding protein DksA
MALDLKARRADLEARLGELGGRLSSIVSDVRQEHSADAAEQAQERENDEVLDAIGNETRESIAQLKDALQRIEDGSYGYCAACGEAISEKRLDVRPEATHCINCAA